MQKGDGKPAVPFLRLACNFLKRLCRGFEALLDGLRSRVNAPVLCLVGAQVLQHIVNRIFKAGAGLVGGLHALGDELAHFKAVDSLRKCAVYLVGTHDGLRSTGDCCVRCGARQKRSDGISRAGFLNSFHLFLYCTLEMLDRTAFPARPAAGPRLRADRFRTRAENNGEAASLRINLQGFKKINREGGVNRGHA